MLWIFTKIFLIFFCIAINSTLGMEKYVEYSHYILSIIDKAGTNTENVLGYMAITGILLAVILNIGLGVILRKNIQNLINNLEEIK